MKYAESSILGERVGSCKMRHILVVSMKHKQLISVIEQSFDRRAIKVELVV